MTEFSLVPHPDFPSHAVRSISVEVNNDQYGLHLTYRVIGAIDDVLWPVPGASGRADRLWEHSCFEAFIAREDGTGYTELNFATSGQWAAYDFEAYRRGMNAVEKISAPLYSSLGHDKVKLSTVTHPPIFEHGSEWRLGLSAIIEEKSGSKSYWALAHPPGKPDFHNADCFTARLAAPERA